MQLVRSAPKSHTSASLLMELLLLLQHTHAVGKQVA
jgi:hypothetical protein